jgi:hypothetical protein
MASHRKRRRSGKRPKRPDRRQALGLGEKRRESGWSSIARKGVLPATRPMPKQPGERAVLHTEGVVTKKSRYPIRKESILPQNWHMRNVERPNEGILFQTKLANQRVISNRMQTNINGPYVSRKNLSLWPARKRYTVLSQFSD